MMLGESFKRKENDDSICLLDLSFHLFFLSLYWSNLKTQKLLPIRYTHYFQPLKKKNNPFTWSLEYLIKKCTASLEATLFKKVIC